MNKTFLATVSWLAFSAACLAQSPATADLTKSDPVAYLNAALDEMQARALRRAAVDWPQVRAEALARASQAKTTVDTYDAIRFALTGLGDHHSSLHLTTELENLEARRKARDSPEPADRGSATARESIFRAIRTRRAYPEAG
jgi:hypothetical protein